MKTLFLFFWQSYLVTLKCVKKLWVHQYQNLQTYHIEIKVVDKSRSIYGRCKKKNKSSFELLAVNGPYKHKSWISPTSLYFVLEIRSKEKHYSRLEWVLYIFFYCFYVTLVYTSCFSQSILISFHIYLMN